MLLKTLFTFIQNNKLKTKENKLKLNLNFINFHEQT